MLASRVLLLLHFNHFPSSSSFYLFVWLNFLLSSFLYQEMYQDIRTDVKIFTVVCERCTRQKVCFFAVFFILLFEKPRQASPTGCPRYFLTRLRKIGNEIQGERRWKVGRLHGQRGMKRGAAEKMRVPRRAWSKKNCTRRSPWYPWKGLFSRISWWSDRVDCSITRCWYKEVIVSPFLERLTWQKGEL